MWMWVRLLQWGLGCSWLFGLGWVGVWLLGGKGEGKGRNGEDIGGEGRCGYECVGDGWLRGAVD